MKDEWECRWRRTLHTYTWSHNILLSILLTSLHCHWPCHSSVSVERKTLFFSPAHSIRSNFYDHRPVVVRFSILFLFCLFTSDDIRAAIGHTICAVGKHYSNFVLSLYLSLASRHDRINWIYWEMTSFHIIKFEFNRSIAQLELINLFREIK